MEGLFEVMRAIPFWLMVIVGLFGMVFWLTAWNFGIKGSTRWQAFVAFLFVAAFETLGIIANITEGH
jgi:hypothetical protein